MIPPLPALGSRYPALPGSINQFVSTALAEELSARMTAEYLEEHARRGDRKEFDEALSRVMDRDPDPGDKT